MEPPAERQKLSWQNSEERALRKAELKRRLSLLRDVLARRRKAGRGRAGSVKRAPTGAGVDVVAQMKKVLGEMVRLDKQKWFVKPVDPYALSILDYFDVIKHPMDLGTVRQRIDSGQCSTRLEFVRLVRLTFQNAMKYNPATNTVHKVAKSLLAAFDKKVSSWPGIPPSGVPIAPEDADSVPVPPISTQPVIPLQKPVSTQVDGAALQDAIMTAPEAVQDVIMGKMWDWIPEGCLPEGDDNDDEVELNIELLPQDSLRKIKKALDTLLGMHRDRLPLVLPDTI